MPPAIPLISLPLSSFFFRDEFNRKRRDTNTSLRPNPRLELEYLGFPLLTLTLTLGLRFLEFVFGTLFRYESEKQLFCDITPLLLEI